MISEHTMTATSPACTDANIPAGGTLHLNSAVDVTVAAGNSRSHSSPDDQFTYHWTYPIVTSVSPDKFLNSGGVRVTISGYNFTGTTEVDFTDCLQYPQPNFTVVNDNTIVIDPTVAAPFDSSGTYSIRVYNASGNADVQSCCHYFTTSNPPGLPPVVTSVTPAGGPEAGGTPVVVRGTHLGSYFSVARMALLLCDPVHDFVTVTFGTFGNGCEERLGDVRSLDENTLIAPSPPGTGTVDVIASIIGASSPRTPADQFTYGAIVTPPASPQITSVSPQSAGRGTPVTITGTNLAPGPGDPTVDFPGCLPIPVSPNPDGSLTAPVPSCAASGLIALGVSNEDGLASTKGSTTASITITGSTPPMSITSFSPTSGPPGTAVTITGDNLAYLTGVSFGCGYVEPTANPDGTLTAIVPDCAWTAPIMVGGNGLSQPVRSSDVFTVTP